MKIYRLEHRSSGLGPFEHRSSRQKHPPQDVLRFLRTNARGKMPDITDNPMVAALVRDNPKCVFGWDSKEKFDEFVIDWGEIQKLGFRLQVYDRIPLYRSLPCGQVIFLK